MRVPDPVLVLPTNSRKSKDFIDCYYGRDVPTKFSEITFQVSRKLSNTFNFLCFSSGRRRYENDLTEFFKLFKDYSRIQASDIPFRFIFNFPDQPHPPISWLDILGIGRNTYYQYVKKGFYPDFRKFPSSSRCSCAFNFLIFLNKHYLSRDKRLDINEALIQTTSLVNDRMKVLNWDDSLSERMLIPFERLPVSPGSRCLNTPFSSIFKGEHYEK